MEGGAHCLAAGCLQVAWSFNSLSNAEFYLVAQTLRAYNYVCFTLGVGDGDTCCY